MAETKISDVIVPHLFTGYVIERSAELSEIRRAGIMERNAEFDSLANAGGQTTSMPFWQDISGDDEVLSDQGSLTPGKIVASKDQSVICNRGRAWSANDLAGILAGDDPMQAIINLVAEYWNRREQATLVKLLTGVFAAASMSGSCLDIHQTSGQPDEDNFLTGETFLDAGQLLGDAKQKLTAVVMHSAVETALLKADMITWVPDSEGKRMFRKFQGLDVIVDDGCPTETINGLTVYHTYVFGRGAIANGFANKEISADGGIGNWYTEYARVALAGSSQLINRRRFIMHPRGVKWTGDSMAGSSPTNSELATGSNWQRVYETKNVRMVRIRHNIA